MRILIKKYRNRRLYDTEKSQYITVDTLKDYVLQGKDFHVQDASTGKDLTNITLIHIMLEMESASLCFLSADALKSLIRLAHQPLHQSMNSMLENIFAQMGNPHMEAGWKQGAELWNKTLEMLQKPFKKP